VRGLAERWADRNDLAIRHVIGKRDFAEFTADLPLLPNGGLLYQTVAYEDRMHLLLAAADLAVTRAGGTVFELAVMGVPSVLVPLPIATRDHQSANAAALAASGGAIVVPDPECTTDRLEAELSPLIDQADLRLKMAEAMRTAAVPDAAERVARLVEERARG
jgi:UDP-N-acetylglucosamine:LPS N-acetylglucosamine transferase